MKNILLCVFLASLASTTLAAAQSCATVTVMARVEVSRPLVTLADLLAPGTCAALFGEASRLRLGVAPLAGSDRVLDGGTVRALLAKAAGGRISLSITGLYVPERVIVRRAVTPATEATKRGAPARLPRRQTPAPAVRPGELVRLLWDQDGIRSVVPVTCLDRGAVGDQVRVRVQPGGRIVTATVMEAGLLRAVL
jgi:hypothetical protein